MPTQAAVAGYYTDVARKCSTQRHESTGAALLDIAPPPALHAACNPARWWTGWTSPFLASMQARAVSRETRSCVTTGEERTVGLGLPNTRTIVEWLPLIGPHLSKLLELLEKDLPTQMSDLQAALKEANIKLDALLRRVESLESATAKNAP